tara:strand:+ start:11269 stop:12741 length:1473 start_codon:yes stop_codon:yes gene_type:complete
MAVESRTSSIDLKGDPGPFLARIVSHLDTTYMGGLEVEILKVTEEGNNAETTGQTAQVKYLPGFYGVTPFNANTENEGYKFSQQSYGMWAVPPDVGNIVLVIFVEGNISMGYWIGCVPDEFMNFQIPGYASTTFNDKDKSKNLPVGEYNKKLAKHKGNDPTKFVKPVNTDLETRLTNAGLIGDNTRGVSSSSARRELPSMVFGWSTPGPYDRRPGAPKYKYGNLGSQSQVPASRLGGSSFVMDDGDANFLRKGPASSSGPEYANVESMEKGGDPTIPRNELIRLQTRTGHQILMHNSEDLIYIANARGTTWIELTSNGKIDIYAKDSVSVHTENDYNITADRDINIEAGRNINITAAKDIKQTTAGGNWEVKVSADGKITCGGTSNITSKHHLETADKIDMNGPPAATATDAKAPTRSPQVEPWAGHENYSPESHNSIATDASIAIVNPVGTAKGTTSTTVADTATKTEEKSATDDTMKKKCVEQSGLVT